MFPLKDVTGVMLLMYRVFGMDFFLNRTWSDFSEEDQLNVNELLAFFLYSVYSRENPNVDPKPSEINLKFEELIIKTQR